MKPINIYALTRINGTEKWESMERQMSCRSKQIKIKQWEVEIALQEQKKLSTDLIEGI